MVNALLYIIPSLIWGTTWYAIKFQLGVVAPLLSVSYRFALAGILIWIYGAATGKIKGAPFSARQHLFAALQGFLLFFLSYWLSYLAVTGLTSGLVAVLFSTLTILNIFNQWLFFSSPIRRPVLTGALIGLAGITLVFWQQVAGFHFHGALSSVLICLAAAYAASLGNITSMRNSRDHMPILKTNAYAMLWGAGFAFLMALASGAPLRFDFSPHYLWSLLYLSALGSALAFVMYLTLIARIGADKAGYTAVLFPVVALIISTFYEHYAWTWDAALGLALVIAGNVLALAKK